MRSSNEFDITRSAKIVPVPLSAQCILCLFYGVLISILVIYAKSECSLNIRKDKIIKETDCAACLENAVNMRVA